jgi:serine/threonine protein kinase
LESFGRRQKERKFCGAAHDVHWLLILTLPPAAHLPAMPQSTAGAAEQAMRGFGMRDATHDGMDTGTAAASPDDGGEGSLNLETVAFALVRPGRQARPTRRARATLPSLPTGIVVADRYMIERPLGSGGMGSVWLARDLTLECPCALKMLDLAQMDVQDCRDRFAREARVSARIRASNVVNVFDYGEWNGVPYIVMEYLPGEDLRTRIARRGALGREATYEIVAQLARALAHAHSAGIVHRDIKPDNVFLVEEAGGESVKLLDFGIAIDTSAPEAPAHSGVFVGTAFYASPEQLSGECVDGRADLWSLSVLAFECLTGERPFRCDSFANLCGMVLGGSVPEFHAVERGLPAELDDWWQKAVARKPEGRFQSGQELTDALGDALELSRTSVFSVRRSLEPAPLSKHGRDSRKVGVLYATGVLLALAIGVGIGVAAEHRSPLEGKLPQASAQIAGSEGPWPE